MGLRLETRLGANGVRGARNRGGRDRAGIRLTVGTKLDGHRLRVSGQSHRLCPTDCTGLVQLDSTSSSTSRATAPSRRSPTTITSASCCNASLMPCSKELTCARLPSG